MLSDLMLRLRALFARDRVEREIDAELRDHLDRQIEALERRGLDRAEAVRRARQAFGGLEQAKEAYRDALGVRWFDECRRDLRMALRSLGAAPMVTAVALLTLALTTGANTAIFSILNALVLRSLPVHEPARLVHLTDDVKNDTGETRIRAWGYPAFARIQERRDLFEAVTAWSFVRFNLTDGGEAQFADGMWADGRFFATLGVPAIAGRTFTEVDDWRGGGPDGAVAVISDACWLRRYGRSPDAIGRVVRLNGVPFTIVGVTPPAFFGPEVGRTFEFIVPLQTEPLVRGGDSVLGSATTNFLTLIARLRPGQSLEEATAAMRRAQPEIRDSTRGLWDRPTTDRYLTAPFAVVPASTGRSDLRSTYERALLVLGAIVGLVLLVGCVNVAHLLVARAVGREPELSLRLALGASRDRLARQLFVESFVLAAAGAGLGVLVADYGSRFLVSQLASGSGVVFLDVSIDRRVLAFTGASAVITSLLFGTAPAFRAARAEPRTALARQGRGSPDRAHARVMGSLMIVQVALSVVLVAAAALFIRSFTALTNRPLGLQPDPVLVVSIDAQRAVPDPAARVPLYRETHDAVLALPNVAAAGVSFLTPFGTGGFTPFIAVRPQPEGPIVTPNEEVFANLISHGWFRTFGTPLVSGRDFTRRDRNGAPRVAIVNETFVRRVLSSRRALGATLTIYPNTPREMQAEIVGVVADAVYSSPRATVPPTWYLPLDQFDVPGFPFASARLSVRAHTGPPSLLTGDVEAVVQRLNPRLVLTFRTLNDQVRGSLSRERLMAQLAGFLGALALLLAGLGLYGVTSYAVSRRRVEIGIRVALGAPPAAVVRLVLGRVAWLVAVGIVAGVVAGAWAAPLVDGLIYDVPARDPMSLAGAAAMLMLLAGVAAWLPARRAARIDAPTVIREG